MNLYIGYKPIYEMNERLLQLLQLNIRGSVNISIKIQTNELRYRIYADKIIF